MDNQWLKVDDLKDELKELIKENKKLDTKAKYIEREIRDVKTNIIGKL